MQLRKRKRVDYSSTTIKTEPSANGTILQKIVPGTRLNNKPVHMRSTTKTSAKAPHANQDSTNNIALRLGSVALKRPTYKSRVDYHNEENQKILPSEMKTLSESLDKWIPVQDKLYYKTLNCPKFLGPKGAETLRLPSDIDILRNIATDLKAMIEYSAKVRLIEDDVLSDGRPPLDTIYKPLINDRRMESIREVSLIKSISDFEVVDRIARIHDINIVDIKSIRQTTIKPILDSTFINRNEVNSISRKLDKKLLKERNTDLPWPNKVKKKKTKTANNQSNYSGGKRPRFADVALFNSA